MKAIDIFLIVMICILSLVLFIILFLSAGFKTLYRQARIWIYRDISEEESSSTDFSDNSDNSDNA